MRDDDDPRADALVAAMIRDRVAAVLETEDAALSGAADGVHRHRSQVRRLRDVLAATRSATDPALLRPLGPALAQWGSALGDVRDAEVRAQVADAALSELGLDDDAVRRRLVDAEQAEYARLHERLVELRRLPRFEDLFDRLRRWDVDAPAALVVPDPGDDLGADDAVRDLLAAQSRRLARAAGRIDGSDHAYHRVRKAARRLRSVTVAAGAAGRAVGAGEGLDDDALTRLARAAKRIHRRLGAHRDQRLFIDRLARQRALGVRAGEPAADYDALVAQAERSAEDGLHELRRSVKRVRRAAERLD